MKTIMFLLLGSVMVSCLTSTHEHRGEQQLSEDDVLWDIVHTPDYNQTFAPSVETGSQSIVLAQIDAQMRKLQPVSADVLKKAMVAIRGGAYPKMFQKRLTEEISGLQGLPPDILAQRISDFKTNQIEKIFYVDRFLFDAPTAETFVGKPKLFHTTAYLAISNHKINRLYPFTFSPKDGFGVRAHTLLIGHGDLLDPMQEFEYYSKHYKRREKWW